MASISMDAGGVQCSDNQMRSHSMKASGVVRNINREVEFSGILEAMRGNKKVEKAEGRRVRRGGGGG